MSTTNGLHHATDEAIDLLYSWMPPLPQPQPLPEAAFSLTLKGTLDGQEALLTARGMTAAEFKENLEAIRGLLDAPPDRGPGQAKPVSPSPPASQPRMRETGRVQEIGWCSTHSLEMTLNTKNGRQWWSHRLPEGGFCKGK